ncbi:Pentatricopeptide repeat-containing protein At4g35130, chloroplastic [Linum perenne]
MNPNPKLSCISPATFHPLFAVATTSCSLLRLLHLSHFYVHVKPSNFTSKSMLMPSSSEPSCFPASNIISLYSSFGCLRNALSVFGDSIRPDTLAWNSIIKAHVDSGLGSQALFLYRKMRQSGVRHDSFTFPIVSKALSMAVVSKVESMVHCVAFKLGFGSDLYFCNTMIEVYSKCGLVFYAFKLFDEMPLRDLVSWTSIITAYISQGDVSYGFELLNRMRVEMEPNSVTLIVMLQGCTAGTNWSEGIQLHGYLVKNGLLTDVSLQNSLLRLYGKMGCVKMVEGLFNEMSQKDIISWNILISFFSLTEDFVKVALAFNQMQFEVDFSSETLTSVITVLGKAGKLTEVWRTTKFSYIIQRNVPQKLHYLERDDVRIHPTWLLSRSSPKFQANASFRYPTRRGNSREPR